MVGQKNFLPGSSDSFYSYFTANEECERGFYSNLYEPYPGSSSGYWQHEQMAFARESYVARVCIYHGLCNPLGYYVTTGPFAGALVYIVHCLHSYSFESHVRLFALKIMSDVEDRSDRNACIPPEVSLPSVSQNSSSSTLPSAVSVAQSSVEAADIASTFSLLKDYFGKKLSALKRDIQEDSLSNSDSIAKKLKEESNILFKFERNKKQFILTLVLQRKSARLPKLSVNENLMSLKVAWKN